MTDTITLSEEKTRRQQRQAILDMLLHGESLTQKQATALDIHRLASRISELKASGWRIEKERLPGNFVRYNLDPSRPRIEDVQPRLPFDEGSAD